MTPVHRPFVVVDLDGTLTIDDRRVPYPDRPLNGPVAEATAAASERYGVMVLTARGMRTWKGDRLKVEQHVRPGVEAWLERHAVAADQVQVGKPWCGPRGFYVDDRNLHLEEFRFRFCGPFAGQPVHAVVVGAPPGDLRALHTRLTRIERWLDVCAWTWLDADTAALDDPLLAPGGDGRAPVWTLVLPVGRGRPCAEAWFALHADVLTGGAIEVAGEQGRAGFALVPAGSDARAVARRVVG